MTYITKFKIEFVLITQFNKKWFLVKCQVKLVFQPNFIDYNYRFTELCSKFI